MWNEVSRTSNAKIWRDDQTGLFSVHTSLARLHYPTGADSSDFSNELNLTPARINNAQLDGWRVTANNWHYALGQPGNKATDGWVGFGGRQGEHWLLSRLLRVGYLHWPARAWEDIGGTPTYTRNSLNFTGQSKTIGPDALAYNVSGTATWNGIWTTPGGGRLDIRWRVEGLELKEEIVINQPARDWIRNNRPPATPASETYFGFVFELDHSDISRWYKNGLIADPDGDFDALADGLKITDEIDRLLAFLPTSYAYSARYARNGHQARDWRSIRKRIWTDAGNTYLLIGVPVLELNSMAAGPVTFDPTFTIAETAEDGMSEAGDEFIAPADSEYGVMYLGAEAGITWDGGWIFRATGIPNAATISTASIALDHGGGDETLPLAGAWWGFNVDTPTDFNAADTHRISDHHARTTATVTDNINTTANHTSPSLVSIIQEIVNRAGYAGDLGLTWRDGGSSDDWYEWSDYTNGAALAADLTVTYAGAAAAQFMTTNRGYI